MNNFIQNCPAFYSTSNLQASVFWVQFHLRNKVHGNFGHNWCRYFSIEEAFIIYQTFWSSFFQHSKDSGNSEKKQVWHSKPMSSTFLHDIGIFISKMVSKQCFRFVGLKKLRFFSVKEHNLIAFQLHRFISLYDVWPPAVGIQDGRFCKHVEKLDQNWWPWKNASSDQISLTDWTHDVLAEWYVQIGILFLAGFLQGFVRTPILVIFFRRQDKNYHLFLKCWIISMLMTYLTH